MSRTVHVYFCYDDEMPTPGLAELNDRRNASVFAALAASGWPSGGETRIYWNNTYSETYGMNILVAGLGSKSVPEFCEMEMLNKRAENARVAAGAAINALKGFGVDVVMMESLPNCVGAVAEGAFLAQWRYKSCDKSKMPRDIQPMSDCAEWRMGETNAKAQNFARMLMETPANMMTPTIFCHTVTEMLEPLGVTCETFDQEWIRRERMGAFLSVAKGSDEEPKFLKLEYNGPSKGNGKTVCLVGKGVTFDAGGISLKPAANMDEMRADMGGAAVSVATVYALAMAQSPGRIVALTPLAENLPSGKANKPGDVVTARNGTTIQVDNTDAEGRLLLCDALCYACDTVKPDLIVDSATLTGAMCVAAGWACSGCFTFSGDIAAQLSRAGEVTGDRIWRMPMFLSHKNKICPAPLADLNNTGPRYGGASNAAAFLRTFVPLGVDYCHLDIASVMSSSPGCDDPSYLSKGMSGRPTRTIAQFCAAFFKN